MKVESHKAAAQFGLHPANLALYLRELGAGFEDSWPCIDEEWVAAVQGTYWQRFRQKTSAEAEIDKPKTQITTGVPLVRGAALVVEKLWRNRKWGAAHVSHEQVQKHTHLPAHELDSALLQLTEKGIIISHGRDGPYSLNPSKRTEVERLAQLAISVSA